MKLGYLLASIFLYSASASAGRVLIIGDSLSATKGIGIGDQVDLKLRGAGHSVRTVAACGSSPASFTSGGSTSCGFLKRDINKSETVIPWRRGGHPKQSIPRLKDLVKFDQSTADMVVIQQGTNLYSYVNNPTAIKTQVKKLLEEFKNAAPLSKCLWVSPPQITNYSGRTISEAQQQTMFRSIQEAIKEYSHSIGRKPTEPICELLNSRSPDLKKNPDGGDGTHFSTRNEALENRIVTSVNDLFSNGNAEPLAQGHAY